MRSFGGVRSRAVFSAWTGLSVLTLVSPCHGQATGDLQAIVRETQKTSSIPKQITLVWWLPEQFWRVSLQRGNSLSQEQAEKMLNIVRPYTLIAAADGRVGPLGGVTYTTGETLRSNVIIKDSKGETYHPLPDSALDPDTKNLVNIMQPMLANMLGALGQNLHFFVFPSKAKDGRLIADAAQEGSFEVWLNATTSFKYRLPLGSVLPPRYDPTTGESFPGNYKFNPYTGEKLNNEAPAKALPPAK
jgi:hypothetical protein